MPEMALLIHPRNMETLGGKLIEFSLLVPSSSNPTALKKKKNKATPFLKITIEAENQVHMK